MTNHRPGRGMQEWMAAELQAERAHPSGPGALSAADWDTLAALSGSPAGSATAKALAKVTEQDEGDQVNILVGLTHLGLVRHTMYRDEVVWHDTPASRAARQRQADLNPETPARLIPVSDPRRSSRTEYSKGVAAQAIAENDDLSRFPDLARQAVINCCADWEAGSGPGDLYAYAQGWAAGYARS